MTTATAIAHPNIALIKYWGDNDPDLHIPSNGSISMNLDGLYTRTRVSFNPHLEVDELTINGQAQRGQALERVSSLLDRVRLMARMNHRAQVTSENNFPMGTGIASSASAFAALALAASQAAGMQLDESQLSRLARTGSGSACRSIPAGFVEWLAGNSDKSSYAVSLWPADHWELVDCIAIISRQHKSTVSEQGHLLASTSPLQAARVADAPRRLELCRRALQTEDIELLAQVVEQDSDMMHGVMMTSTPALHYWQPATLRVMEAVRIWRKNSWPVFYTVDAGPNVHVLCLSSHVDQVVSGLAQIPDVNQVLVASPGGAARIEPEATLSTLD